MMEKRAKPKRRAISDRERWRNLCDVLAEDALRAPHSGQHFPRPTEEEWHKLCDLPRAADAEPEDKPAHPVGGMIPGSSFRPGSGFGHNPFDLLNDAERLFEAGQKIMKPEGEKSEPAKEEPAPEKETVKKTGPKKPGS